MTHFPIDIITTLADNTHTKNLIIEIRSPDRIALFAQYGFSPLQIEKIQENLSLDVEKQKKTITFSHISSTYDMIMCFFPSLTLMDDRASLFSSLKQSTLFVPE